MEKLILSNGYKINSIGLGATAISSKDRDIIEKKQYDIYLYALLSQKCNLFDTSSAYGTNEIILGKALREASVDRKDITLISKVSNYDQRSGNIREALERSLEKLQTEYLDIYLIHWPQPSTFLNTYRQMEELYKEGKIKGIGVCNCNIHHLEYLFENVEIYPLINQFEVHPLFTQTTLRSYCEYREIQVMAYTPIGRMHDVLMNSRAIRELAKKYDKKSVQIIIQWHKQLGNIAIPRTLNIDHFKEIFEYKEFKLEKKEMEWINSLNDNIRLRYNSDTCDFNRL